MSDMSNSTRLYSYSLNANHSLSIAVMRDDETQYDNNRYYCFISVAPRILRDDGQASYDYKNSITFKVQPVRVAELGNALDIYAKGQQKLIGQFGIYVDSSKSKYGDNLKKYLSLMTGTDKNNNPVINLIAKTSNMEKGHSLQMNVPTALALSTTCKIIYEEIIKLGFNSSGSTNYKSKNNNKSYHNTDVDSSSDVSVSTGSEESQEGPYMPF